MQYLTVAEAYRDLEQASGRLALAGRLAALLAGTPAGLLPVVCYLCQGLIAPEFAGVDLGLAERFPRFTGRWRDDKAPEDATTTGELVGLYRAARRTPAGTEAPGSIR